MDILKFKAEITKIQDNATRRLTKLCPQFFNDSSYLAKIAGNV
jgi:hypothetical protein